VAGAIAKALAMPVAERRERHVALLNEILENNVDKWQGDFLDALRSQDRSAEEIQAAMQAPTFDRPAAKKNGVVSRAASQGRA
jgi:trehalose-6-phosphate synthase